MNARDLIAAIQFIEDSGDIEAIEYANAYPLSEIGDGIAQGIMQRATQLGYKKENN